jgi:hypothetical protein
MEIINKMKILIIKRLEKMNQMMLMKNKMKILVKMVMEEINKME